MTRKRGRPPNTSPQITALVRVLKDYEWHYGYELCKTTGIAPGTIYPTLRRLAKQGVLEARWEVTSDDKPPRRLYRIPQVQT